MLAFCAFIILPNQLFYDLRRDAVDYYLIEHPIFFTKYPYNKAKLVMHRYTMKLYAKHIKCHYIEYHQNYQQIFKKYKRVYAYDPVDHFVASDFNSLAKKYKTDLQYLVNPGWIEGSLEYKGGRIQTNFYRWQRQRLKLFTNRMNPLIYDSQNRKPFKKELLSKTDKAIFAEPNNAAYKEAVTYVERHFKSNPGLAYYWLPGTHAEAVKYLHKFFKYRLREFGPYEDAIHPDTDFGFHSVISPILNIGLLTPDFIIREVKKVYSRYPFQSIEGYIRQIIGWREFCRLVYVHDGPQYGNRFGATRPLPAWWYKLDERTVDADYGEYPKSADPEIIHYLVNKVWRLGYLHHIERLMIIGNFMSYAEFRPDHCYRWFMSAFLDSYHVFMEPNLYGMVLNCIDKSKKYKSPYALPRNYAPCPDARWPQTKQYMTNRMYICSSNYIKKMGWPLTPADVEKFDAAYQHFLRKHKAYLAKNYANARNVSHLKK